MSLWWLYYFLFFWVVSTKTKIVFGFVRKICSILNILFSKKNTFNITTIYVPIFLSQKVISRLICTFRHLLPCPSPFSPTKSFSSFFCCCCIPRSGSRTAGPNIASKKSNYRKRSPPRWYRRATAWWETYKATACPGVINRIPIQTQSIDIRRWESVYGLPPLPQIPLALRGGLVAVNWNSANQTLILNPYAIFFCCRICSRWAPRRTPAWRNPSRCHTVQTWARSECARIRWVSFSIVKITMRLHYYDTYKGNRQSKWWSPKMFSKFFLYKFIKISLSSVR